MSGLVARVPVSDSSILSTKVQAVYDRMLLERAVDNQIFDIGAQVKTIPARSNAKKAFAYRYKNILPATTPLAEYNGSNIKAPNKIVREEIEYEVGHYGDYIVFTDELELYDFDNIRTSFLDILGDQADITVDTIRRDTLRGGNNVVYAGGVASQDLVASGSEKLVVSDFKTMAIKLKNQRAKKFKRVVTGTTRIGTTPIRSAYLGIISPEMTEDLRDLAGWKNVEDYADYSKSISEDEVGSISDFRCIESTNNAPIVNDSEGSDINIHIGYFFGENAYCTTTLRGKQGIRTIVKSLGSAGSEDPLDQYGTIGWKAITGAAILNEAWLIRVETTASFEDSTPKHYYDYS